MGLKVDPNMVYVYDQRDQRFFFFFYNSHCLLVNSIILFYFTFINFVYNVENYALRTI